MAEVDFVDEDLAKTTLQTVDAALKEGQVASMPELVRIIRALSKDEGSVSIGELAEMINQDSTVLTRVIAAANTFGYNPTNIEIGTVSEAIHTIGFNRVRMLSMSLMLLDHAGRVNSPMEQRQMASISLCSGILAQVTAEHAGMMNPEMAFVCASLRNFGRLLLGTFMTDDFRAATAAADSGEGDEAYRRYFGLTPYELGYELLKSANLPKTILLAIQQHEPALSDKVDWSDKAMHRLANFSLKFSEMALDADLTDRQFAKAQNQLIKGAGKDFRFLIERAPNLLKEAEQRLSLLAASTGNAAFGRVSRERLRHRSRRTPLNGKPEPVYDQKPPSYLAPQQANQAPGLHQPAKATPPPGEADLAAKPKRKHALEEGYNEEEVAPDLPPAPALEGVKPPPPPSPEPQATPEENPPAKPKPKARPREKTHTAMDTLVRQLQRGTSDKNPLPIALNAVRRTLNPLDVFFCAPDINGRAFRIVLGMGPISDRLGERSLFYRTDRNALFLCHDRLINLSIQNTEDPRVWRHLPGWLQTGDAPRSFLALPVHHERVLQGILFIGWERTRKEPFGGPELNTVQSLFDLVAKHFRKPASKSVSAAA